MSKNDFFIGWGETPRPDRRFFLGAGLALLGGTAATAGTVAALQNRPGPGTWNMGEIRTFHGIATAEPYAMLRTRDLDGTPQTVLLGCQGKCGVSAKIGALSGKAVTVRGSLIQRGPHAMIAVIDSLDWIVAAEDRDVSDLAFPTAEPVMDIKLRGEILDTKCWFGAMSPNQGKVHKACASLCIRGGIPPGFYVTDIRKQNALMIMTDRGIGFGKDILEYVADPVAIQGTVKRQGNLLLLDTSAAQIRRA